VCGEEAVAAIAGAYGQQAGELVLGASQTIGQCLLPQLIATFLNSYPRVSVTARSDNSDATLEALMAGEIQLALIEGPEQRRDLRIEPFMEDHMVLVVPAGHEWADQEVEVGDFCRQRLLLREFGSGSRRVVEQCLAAVGLKEKVLSAAMEFDSNEGLLSAVEAGLGVTFVSRWAVRNQLSLGTLKLARIGSLKLSRKFSMAYPAGPEPVGNVGAFRAILPMRSLDLAPRTRSSAAPLIQKRKSTPERVGQGAGAGSRYSDPLV
jgi:DNA-binding transcriptional LysR family regulator